MCGPHRDARGVGVLGHVRERLRDDVEDRHLDRAREPLVEVDFQLDRNRRALRERLERRFQAAVAEDRRVEATRKLAQFLERERELLPRAGEDARGRLGLRTKLRLGEPERERQRDEPLLGTVVEIPLESPPLCVGSLDETGSRATHLLFVALAGGDVHRTDQVVLLAICVERSRPPLDDDLAAVRRPPRCLDSREAAGLRRREEGGARTVELAFGDDELPERAADRVLVVDAGRCLER